MSVAPLHHGNAFHNDPKFGRLLFLSLIAHALIWAAFSVGWFGSSTRPKPPVYYVDLIHKPVLNPQAGRPEPRPMSKPEPVKKPAATITPSPPKVPAKPAVKAPPKPPEVTIPKPQPKPAAKPVAKPVAKTEQRKDQKVLSAIEEIRQRQQREAELDALKNKLAKLRESAGAAVSVPADVPIGMPDGQGDEVGSDVTDFVRTYIQENWNLSPYLLDQSRIRDYEAKATLAYSASGKLVRFRINSPSGNQQFDDSLKKAIALSDQLPQPLPRDLELIVTFNLKDIAAARR